MTYWHANFISIKGGRSETSVVKVGDQERNSHCPKFDDSANLWKRILHDTRIIRANIRHGGISGSIVRIGDKRLSRD